MQSEIEIIDNLMKQNASFIGRKTEEQITGLESAFCIIPVGRLLEMTWLKAIVTQMIRLEETTKVGTFISEDFHFIYWEGIDE